MEKEKRICRKKRNLAKSIVSLMLVFAMVISNVQTSSGMLSTVWAAESEAQTLDGEAETGSVDEGNDSDGEETGETQKSLESEEANSEERSEAAPESTQAGESERSEETSEGGSTETTTASAVETETASEAETASETETTTETETETEATEEESNAFLGEGTEGENPAAEQISIKLHFKDVLGWDTEKEDIHVAYASYDSKWVTNYDGGAWPGVVLTSGADGYYTLNLENVTKPTGEGFVFVFHNGDGNGKQTDDYVIPISAFSGDTAEYWISAAKVGNYGKHFAQVSSKEITEPIVSPEITTSGVTFRYVNAFEDTVSVSGSMDGWTSHPMDKGEEGIFTYTYTETLSPGEYEYGFSVNGWSQDPNNELRKGNNNTFTITDSAEDEIISPEVNGSTVTFRYKNDTADTVLLAGEMNGWNGDPKSENCIKMTKDETSGIFTHTMDLDPDHGICQYKFVVISGATTKWELDPSNDVIFTEEGGNQNSVVYILGTEQYEYTIHYYNPGVGVPTSPDGPDLHIWDKCPGAAVGQQYTFTDIITDEDTTKGKTWLTTKVTVPYPHISIIARPAGDWTNQDDERTYELKKDAKTAELWLVYGEGLYDKNPYLDTYKYTVHYYNPSAPTQSVDIPDLYVGGKGSGDSGKLYSFTETLEDTDNNINWLTTVAETPYTEIKLIGKPNKGENWDGEDKPKFYQLKGEAKEAELWYIHGMGVYETKPIIKLDSVEADLSLESMDYTQNNVLSLVFDGNKDTKVLIKSASVDASELGISSNLTIDPQLCEVTLSVRDCSGQAFL